MIRCFFLQVDGPITGGIIREGEGEGELIGVSLR